MKKKGILFIVLITVGFGFLSGCNEQVSQGEPPVIHFFTATPGVIYLGNVSVLNWSITGATSVNIDVLGNVALSGPLTVGPATNTTYVLTATNSYGSVNSSLIIYVLGITYVTDEETPELEFRVNENLDRLEVLSSDGIVNWSSLSIEASHGCYFLINAELSDVSGTKLLTNIVHQIGDSDVLSGAKSSADLIIDASDFIDFEATAVDISTPTEITITHTSTDTLIGIYTLQSIASRG